MQNHYDRYDHIKFIALRATTWILRTYQAGLVNYTLVDPTCPPSQRVAALDG